MQIAWLLLQCEYDECAILSAQRAPDTCIKNSSAHRSMALSGESILMHAHRRSISSIE